MNDTLASVPAATILVVDDNRENLRLLAGVLTDQGYTVRLAPNGQIALQSVQAQLPDLILLDVRMPEMDGYQVCAELKADEHTQHIPVLFISAAGEVLNKVKAFSAGGVDYITKPFQIKEVLARVETHLTLRSAQKRLEEKNIQLEREISERVLAQARLQRRNQELDLLNQVGQELTATLDPQLVIEQLLQAVTVIIDADGASVWLEDQEHKGWQVCRAVFEHGQSNTLANLRLGPGEGIVGWVVEHGESIIVNNASNDPRFAAHVDEQTGFRTNSVLAAPLRVRGTIIGVLEVVNKRRDNFDLQDRALVETIAASAGIAIDNAALVEALRHHTAELQASNKELDAFAHTVAHDLQNPLAQVIGYAEILKEDYTTIPAEDLGRWLGMIAKIARRMSVITDELLLLSSVRQMDEIETQALNMASIVAQVQERLASTIEEFQAEIILPPDEAWPTVIGYSPWIEEVWVNYLNNALKYGGRPPRIELGADPLPESSTNTGSQVRFWIRDNGPGISPEDQDRIFSLFTRLDQVRTKGHGLGLSIVRRIVEKLGGEAGVDSHYIPGEGSTFWFTLPAIQDM